jgi:hypothetical protein
MPERIFTEDLFKKKPELPIEDYEKDKYEVIKIKEDRKNKLLLKYGLIALYFVLLIAAFLLIN